MGDRNDNIRRFGISPQIQFTRRRYYIWTNLFSDLLNDARDFASQHNIGLDLVHIAVDATHGYDNDIEVNYFVLSYTRNKTEEEINNEIATCLMNEDKAKKDSEIDDYNHYLELKKKFEL